MWWDILGGGGALENLKDNLIHWLNQIVQINIYIYIGISEGGKFLGKWEIYILSVFMYVTYK